MENDELIPKIGLVYKHFKGNLYEVLMMSTDTRSGEDMVIYKCLKTSLVFNRPLEEWFDIIDDLGTERFTLKWS